MNEDMFQYLHVPFLMFLNFFFRSFGVRFGGFRPAQRFLPATYHAGTVDSGEDLRAGASATWTVEATANVKPST